MAVTFGLFGTLVEVSPVPRVPTAGVGDAGEAADALAAELEALGVAVPDDWEAAYRERHVDAPEGAAVPLPAHVSVALSSRGVDAPGNAARRAVVNAFDPTVRTRPGAVEAVAAAREAGPVGLLADCDAPELLARTLIRSALDRDAFDATVAGVGCGWRKPDPRAFEAAADALSVSVEDLIHVGADPAADGGVVDAGGEFFDASERPLTDLAARLAADGR